MSDATDPSGTPTVFDIVEVIGPRMAARVLAVVESAQDLQLVIRTEAPTDFPREALLRWSDGTSSWQVQARLESLEETRASCVLASTGWGPAPPRPKLRVRTDNAPMLIRAVDSKTLPSGRHMHALCVDVSDTNCRASWPGPAPNKGDTVEVAWDADDWHDDAAPEWIRARIERVIPRPFSTRHVCLAFETDDNATEAARVRTWFLRWLRRAPTRQRAE